jgi:L-threonylcarbamoyladenylate synthase
VSDPRDRAAGGGPVVVPAEPTAGGPPTDLTVAVDALRAGSVVGIPTDTVYGLAVDPSRPGAADRIFAAKGRPRTVTLPVLVADEAQALGLSVAVSPAARALMARWWPGPLTIVVDRRAGIDFDLGDEAGSIGLRCPDHPVPLALAARAGPIATTSANRHGRPPVTTAAELAATLPDVAVVVDAGTCDGAPSTVVDCRGPLPRLLRAGQVDWPAIEATIGV